ncbi:hypothetical protein AO946_09145 [Pseudomonas aeruginosa]|nr:hypothetical protein AO946_09145 [Pseudomonas aeruginosa]PBN23795.1 hypothetical protein B8B65_28635 [Pseudomonas aeruginosa]RPS13241.1 hypothetical protein IPC1015_33215 [Pseudomonas aeruginosa]
MRARPAAAATGTLTAQQLRNGLRGLWITHDRHQAARRMAVLAQDMATLGGTGVRLRPPTGITEGSQHWRVIGLFNHEHNSIQ